MFMLTQWRIFITFHAKKLPNLEWIHELTFTENVFRKF